MIVLHRIRQAACLAVGLGISSSAFGQFLKTERFNANPGWIGVNNTQFDEPVDGTSEAPKNGYTNFGFSNTDNTLSTIAPPGGTASGAGEAGGGLANNPGLLGLGQGYYADNVGSLTMNQPLTFSGVLAFTENRDRMRLGFFQSFDSPTNNPYVGQAGNQPGPNQGSHRRPEFLGIEGDAGDGGVRLTLELGRSRNFESGGFNQSTANSLTDSGVIFIGGRGLGTTPPVINPIPLTVTYDPNGGPQAFGSISMTIPGATFSFASTNIHRAVIQDDDLNGIDDEDADGNDSPADAPTFTMFLTEAQRNTANAFVFDRFGMITGSRDPNGGAEDDGQNAFIDDMTYSTSINPSGGVLGDFDADGDVDATDIDLLCDRINAGTGDVELFDVNNDGSVNTADVVFEVEEILDTTFGDTDTDGDVDLNDLGNLASGFNVAGEKRWSRGNFDCDLDVDLPDLGTLATNFGAGRAAAFAQFEALVPEPASFAVFALAAIPLAAARRRRV